MTHGRCKTRVINSLGAGDAAAYGPAHIVCTGVKVRRRSCAMHGCQLTYMCIQDGLHGRYAASKQAGSVAAACGGELPEAGIRDGS